MKSLTVLLGMLMLAASMSGCLENLGIGESNDESRCNNDVCVGISCGFPAFDSLDNDSNGILDAYEFVYGLYDFDSQYNYESYYEIFEEIISSFTNYYDDEEDDDENEDFDDDENDQGGNQESDQVIGLNETLYGILGINEYTGICFGLYCGPPSFVEIDSDGSGYLDSEELVNGMSEIEPGYTDEFQEVFNELSGDDGLLDESEYEIFERMYVGGEDPYCEDCDDSSNFNHSEDEIKFFPLMPNCYQLKFFDGNNQLFGGWGGKATFVDSDGVTSTIMEFSYHNTYVYLDQTKSWTIEYEFDETDIGFVIDGVTYGGDNENWDDDPVVGSVKL